MQRGLRTAAVGGSAVPELVGGGPDELPRRYRVGDPLAAVPITAAVLCVHSRADQDVPYSQSLRYVDAATKAGATARLHEVSGDHLAHVDPRSLAWAVVVDALPALVTL